MILPSAAARYGILALVAAAEAQLIHWDLTKVHDRRSPALYRRNSAPLEESVKNEQSQGGYFATVSVGTPGQKVSLQLDTGSSDLWVPSVKADICREAKDGGCSQGSCKELIIHP